MCGTLLSGEASAQQTPGSFTPDPAARAIAPERVDWNARSTSGNAFEMTSSGNTLRWRVKQPTSAGTSQAVSVVTKKSNSRVARAHHVDNVKDAGVFADPFGDRGAVRLAQAVEPLDDDPPLDLDPSPELQPRLEEDEAPGPPSRLQPPPRFEDDAPPARPEPPMRDDPMFERPPRRADDPKYNKRDCDDDVQNCAEARQNLRLDLLSEKELKRLIDITPPLLAGSEKNLARVPRRVWRDRKHNIVADGRLLRLEFRHAVIKDLQSGEEITIGLDELGDDEQCFLAGWWNVPSECTLAGERHPGRNYVPMTMTFTASALCHKPLYFEEVQLERYGHTAGLAQPVLSGAHFFLNIAFLPYKMGINPPNECQYALGYYRPGSCAPWLVPPVPLSVRGAAAQAAVVVGVSPLIP